MNQNANFRPEQVLETLQHVMQASESDAIRDRIL
jgi:hypothetical protein